MRRLEIEPCAHDDVETCPPGDALERRGIAANSEVGGVDDRLAAVFDEMAELLDGRTDFEERAIVAVQKRIHAKVADHRNVERPFGEADVARAAWPPPPA